MDNEAGEIVGLKGPPVGYVDLLDDQINSKQDKELEAKKAGTVKNPKNPLRPSAAGACERALAFQLMEYTGQAFYEKPRMEPSVVRLLGLGHNIESHLIYFLNQCELFEVKYKQQTLGFFSITAENKKLDHFLEGQNDLCFISKVHGWNAVVDIKSKGDKFSASHKSKWDEDSEKYSKMKSVQVISDTSYWVADLPAFLEELNDSFFAANFLQLNLYGNSSFMKERGIDHGVIMQYNKNNSKLREVRFNLSKELYDKVESKFRSAASAVDQGDPFLAKKDNMPGSVACAFCDFKQQCWGELDVQKEFFKTLPGKYWPKRANEIPVELHEKLLKFHTDKSIAKKVEQLELDICKEMLDNKIYKVDIGEKVVYEVKTYKHSVSLKRGKA